MAEIEIPETPEDVFKGSKRAIQLKKIRTDIRNGILLIGLVTSIFLFVYMDARLAPFYLPLDTFVCVMVIVTVGIGCVSLVFKIVDLKYVSTTSTKFFMIRKFRKRSFPIFGACIIVGTILILPQTSQTIEMYLTTEKTEVILSNSSLHREFWTKDNIGFTRVKSITMNLTHGNYLIVTIEKFDKSLAIVVPETNLSVGKSKTFAITSTKYQNFTITFCNPTNSSTKVCCIFETEMSRLFFSEIPVILLSYSLTIGCWTLYLVCAERKYRKGSIFE
jgi:hypothetical protein